MATGEGHDSGHGLSWGAYIAEFVKEFGGLTALADELVRRASDAADVPTDTQTVERGLRRLAARGNKPGGQYGRWMLRHFGLPVAVERWGRYLAQYHSRYSDLPVPMRGEQLQQWNRPPMSESRAAVWVDLAFAALALRRGDLDDARQHADRAGGRGDRIPDAARLELTLLVAFLRSQTGDRELEADLLSRAQELVERAELEGEDRACYRARILDQRAYRCRYPVSGAPDEPAARRLYQAIPAGSGIPFVEFRRALGLAYCAALRGDRARARELATGALAHAGDGGFVRLRIMAMKLLAQVSEEPECWRARALALAARLEDEDLRMRLAERPD